MNISYTWTYTKVDGQWYVKSRAMGGAAGSAAGSGSTSTGQ